MTTQYPVLTYGTLRPGHHNYMLLDGYTTYEADVQVQGFDMYVFPGFPYVLDGKGTIKGTLSFIDPEFYNEVMADLDYLEGFSAEGNPWNHYDRTLVDVEFAGTTIKAWMYVARQATTVDRVLSNLMPWADGDWNTFAMVAA
jgi:gamma-glutamylcyclotransferase (GGCT)/AIG2-like uncharacterized protein YtfP